MVSIEPVLADSPKTLVESVRWLFRAYGQFLLTTGEHHGFSQAGLEEEILSLPKPYTDRNGELLLAAVESQVAGCIAYRAFVDDAKTCELKRLFVAPAYRGQNLGKQLLCAAMDRARSRGYGAACLDTEPAGMAAAHRLYTELGFTEFKRLHFRENDPTVFLRKQLV